MRRARRWWWKRGSIMTGLVEKEKREERRVRAAYFPPFAMRLRRMGHPGGWGR